MEVGKLKFRQYIKELAQSPSRTMEKLILDISELAGKEVAGLVANDLEKNPHRHSKDKLVKSLISVVYEALTKDRPENYEVADFHVDETKFHKNIDKFREKNPKFNSICIRLGDVAEEYSKSWTK